MKYRLAKSCDAIRIAEIQSKIKEVNSLGIFCHMRIGFLKQYYKLIIEDPESVFICAIDDNNKIVGYNFMVLDAEKQNENIKKHKYELVLASISSILHKPKLLKQLINRYHSVENNDSKYLHNAGAHGGYWGWDPMYPNSEASLKLHELTLFIMKQLGTEVVFFEVDNDNTKILRFHKINGAKIEKEIKLHDGRIRSFMYYNLNTHKFKL